MKYGLCPYCGAQVPAAPSQRFCCRGCGAALYADSEGAIRKATVLQQSDGAAQQTVQPAPQQTVQQPTPQEVSEQQRAARSNRGGWYAGMAGMLLFQTLLFCLGQILDSKGSIFGIFVKIAWLLTIPLFAVLAPALRPDGMYPGKKAGIPLAFAHILIQFALGVGTLLSGCGLYLLYRALFL